MKTATGKGQKGQKEIRWSLDFEFYCGQINDENQLCSAARLKDVETMSTLSSNFRMHIVCCCQILEHPRD